VRVPVVARRQLHHRVRRVQCLVPVRPVLQAGLGHPGLLVRRAGELPHPEHPVRLVLPEPVWPLARWRYCPFPAQGCFDYSPPKAASPRKR